MSIQHCHVTIILKKQLLSQTTKPQSHGADENHGECDVVVYTSAL